MTAESKEQIRRRMLFQAKILKDRRQFSCGYVPGILLAAVKDDAGAACAADDQAIDLIGDLVAWGLLDEDASPVIGGTARQFRHRRFRITAKGYALWAEEIDPIPGVADRRLEA